MYRQTLQHYDSKDGLATVGVACSSVTVKFIVTPSSLVIQVLPKRRHVCANCTASYPDCHCSGLSHLHHVSPRYL